MLSFCTSYKTVSFCRKWLFSNLPLFIYSLLIAVFLFLFSTLPAYAQAGLRTDGGPPASPAPVLEILQEDLEALQEPLEPLPTGIPINESEENQPPPEVILDEDITLADLDGTEANILPGSPFHVFKRFGRNVREALTFNPAKKANIRYRHANQELAEIKQLLDRDGESIGNPADYARAIQRFRYKLGQVEDSATDLRSLTGEDADRVNEFLDNIASGQIHQQKFLNILNTKFVKAKDNFDPFGESGAELERTIGVIQDSKEGAIENVARVLTLVDNSPESLSNRIIKAFDKESGSAFNDLAHLAILESMQHAIPENVNEAIDLARKNSIEHFENKIRDIPPAVRAEKLGDYIEHTNTDEIRLFQLLENIKQEADIPSDILDKIEEAKEIVVKKFETKLASINNPDVESKFLNQFQTSNVDDLLALEEFRHRMKAETNALKRVVEEHDRAVDAFKVKFVDAQSRDQADLFQYLSREMRGNPSPKTFKLIRELEQEVRNDPAKSAFLDTLEQEMQREVQDKYRREGDLYINRYASLDPEDIAVFDVISFDPAFKDKVLKKKADKLKGFAREIERPEDFDRFYERFFGAPENVINQIKKSDPEFQQAMQFKLRKIEEKRTEDQRDRSIEISKIDYKERELTHQTDRLDRQEEEEFHRRLQEIPWENFDERKKVWEEKINKSYERLDKKYATQKSLFEARLRLDPFGCDTTCQDIQIKFFEQGIRHNRESLADQLQSQRVRIEAERSQFERNNPLAGKCDTPESCEDYCRINRELRECGWFVDIPVVINCPAPSFWDDNGHRCVYPEEAVVDCQKGFYYDGGLKTCVVDPYYRTPDDFRNCGWGLRWNNDKGFCEKDKNIRDCKSTTQEDGTVSYSAECDRPDYKYCPALFRWDEIKKDCVQVSYRECGNGFYFDFRNNRCETDQRSGCGEKESWDETKKVCIANYNNECPAYDAVSCSNGFYSEPYRDDKGCWSPGECKQIERRCPKEPYSCPAGLQRETFVRGDGCTDYTVCRAIACPVIDPLPCQEGYYRESYKNQNGCNVPGRCLPRETTTICPDVYFEACPENQQREFYLDESKGCNLPGECRPNDDNPNSGWCPAGKFNNNTQTQACDISLCPNGCKVDARNCPYGCIEDKKQDCSINEYTIYLDASGKKGCDTNRCKQGCNYSENGCPVSCKTITPIARCGDNICQGSESRASCPVDCKPAETCNNNKVCDDGETYTNCASDCVYPGSKDSCPGFAFNRYDSNNNRYCQLNTSRKCSANFPDYLSELTYKTEYCPAEVICNNNNICDPGETFGTCGNDCGSSTAKKDACEKAGVDWVYDSTNNLCTRKGIVCPDVKACLACSEYTSTSWCDWDNNGCPNGCKATDEGCWTGDSEATCYAIKGCEWYKPIGGSDPYCTKTSGLSCASTPYKCISEPTCSTAGFHWCLGECWGNADKCDTCGDNICGSSESVTSCPADCLDKDCAGRPYSCKTQESCLARGSYWCDGRCESNVCAGGGESCGNGRCETGETVVTCPGDCGSTSQCSTTPSYCSTQAQCAANNFFWCSGTCVGTACGTSCNGNGTCDSDETIASCPADCTDSSTYCGSGWTYNAEAGSCVRTGIVCSTPKACDSCKTGSTSSYCEWNNDGCPVSCRSTAAYCGDNICKDGENSTTCPADCGSATTETCGNNYCGPGETATSCPADCSGGTTTETCGNNYCGSGETASNCPVDCGGYNSVCTYTTEATCSADTACIWYTPPAGGTGSCSSNWNSGTGDGSCPSGYHYHGDSGGYCMNEQENYSGTCYNSSGTTIITCPSNSTGSGSGSGCGSYTSQSACTSVSNCYWFSGSPSYCYYDSSGGTSSGSSCNYNNICDNSESCSTCAVDCCPSNGGSGTTCDGDGVCEANESAASCPVDCGGGSSSSCSASNPAGCTSGTECSNVGLFWCATTSACYQTQASNPCSTTGYLQDNGAGTRWSQIDPLYRFASGVGSFVKSLFGFVARATGGF